jgi:hypothetical protein
MRWATVIFALAVISAIVVYGQEKGSPSAARQNDGQNPQAPQSNCSIIVPSPVANCPAIGVESKKAPQDQQDRTANHPNGYFSRLIAPENVTQLGLLIAGIIGIIVAVRTLGHLRTSSERQLQAYVFPDSVGLLDGTMTTPLQPARANVPGVGMLIKNYGQTPGYRVVSWAQIAVINVANENTLVIPPIQTGFYNNLGPGANFSKAIWFDRPLTTPEIADILSGTRAIYLYGRIEYRDVFEKPRFTNFRLRYNGAFPPLTANVVFNFSESGNDAG